MRTADDLGIASLCLGIQAVAFAGTHILDVGADAQGSLAVFLDTVVFLDIPAEALLDSLAVVYLGMTPYFLPPVAGQQALHQTPSVPAQSDWGYGGGGAW